MRYKLVARRWFNDPRGEVTLGEFSLLSAAVAARTLSGDLVVEKDSGKVADVTLPEVEFNTYHNKAAQWYRDHSEALCCCGKDGSDGVAARVCEFHFPQVEHSPAS